MNARKPITTAIALSAIFNLQSSICFADDFVPAVDTVPYNTSTSYTLDSGDSGGDITLQFGTTLAEFLKWNSVSTGFDLSDDLNLTGGLTTSGGANSLNNNSNFATTINTGTSTGAVSIGGNANTVAVDSSSWDISTAGVASGLTGLTTTGTVSLGNSTGTVAIDSSDWDISATGAMTGIGAVTMDGLLTGTAGATLSGAAINLNDGSNFSVNIGTGASTGLVSIGGGSGTMAVNTTSWDITSAGVGSGFTGLTSTGTVDFSGSTSFRLHEAAANPGTCAVGQLFYNTTQNQLEICNATNTWVNGPDTATFTDATPAAFADNNTTELDNEATAPNITTDSASSTVLVSFSIYGSTNDADDETRVVSVVRDNTGANPVCGTDPQVGGLYSAFKTAAGVLSISGTFLDAPGVAGNIRYNVCTNAASTFGGDLDTGMTSVDMTLVEMGN